MMLTVFIDFNSPASYLAIQPTVQLVQRIGVRVKWKPYRTELQKVPEKLDIETQGQSHRRVRAIARQRIHQHYATLQGIELNFRSSQGKTDIALGIFSQWKSDPQPFIREAFKAYWQDHADLNDKDTVEKIISRCGNVNGIDVSEALSSLEAAQTEAEQVGVIDAPAYWLQDQLFIGREHLPWINEIVKGTQV